MSDARHRRFLGLGLALAAGLAGACTFNPIVPNARVVCTRNADCPSGYTCESIPGAAGDLSVCCKDSGCAAQLSDAAVQHIKEAVKDAGRDAPADASTEAPPNPCGNARLDDGETCDPISTCPTICPQIGCETYELRGAAATCNATCVLKGEQTACISGDGCCAAGCGSTDTDCNCACGNGQVETSCGEVCDPLSSCPTSCAPDGCTLRRVANPGTCQAQCVIDRMQTMCISGDGCCPPTCNATVDTDCAARCGNGVTEPGEKCDGADCPASCPAIGCQQRKLQGTAAACTAECVDTTSISVCAGGDHCCPSGCILATDSDCSCRCGNGLTEAACNEKCDGASCPTSCPPVGCQLRTLQGTAAACTAECVNGASQTACVNGDGCCPPGCNANNDNDCTPHCGNGAIEAGEACDPVATCPATCPWAGCARKILTGSAAACTARCADDGTQTACAHGDGCCPPGCNSATDHDCGVRCGNGVVETGETCDGNCPTSCPPIGCQRRLLQGTAAACTAECVNDTIIATCTNGDGCCASGCTSVGDNDCGCQCGNGVTEAACSESCDGNCPTSCPPVGCQLRALQGTATLCTAKCVNTTLVASCTNGDACCPPGCNANNDNNCTPVCGNSQIESGEKCDPPSACQTQFDACVPDANTIRTRTGMVADCTFACTSVPRPCSATADGFCPTACAPCTAGCTASQDIDCKYGQGTPCTHVNQCATGNCVDSVCCNTACSGACDVCTGGACTLLAAGAAGSPSCSPLLCTGASASCPVTCAGDSSCIAGDICVNGGCQCERICSTNCRSGFSSDGCGGTCPPNCSGCCNNDTDCILPPFSCQ